MGKASHGPGLAKAGQGPLYVARTMLLAQTSDARWRALFEKADVVSEGAPSGADPHRRYYGSTNIILLIAEERGVDGDELLHVAARDPHVRLRALRTARREAEQRSLGPLASMNAEIAVTRCAGGIAIHVDVEAEALPDRRTHARAPSQHKDDGPAREAATE